MSEDESIADVVIEDAVVLRETPKAIFVELDNSRGNRQLWIPQSVVQPESEVWNTNNAGPGKLVVAGWWAEKEKEKIE